MAADGAMPDIQELKGLMRRAPVDHKSGTMGGPGFTTVNLRGSTNARNPN